MDSGISRRCENCLICLKDRCRRGRARFSQVGQQSVPLITGKSNGISTAQGFGLATFIIFEDSVAQENRLSTFDQRSNTLNETREKLSLHFLQNVLVSVIIGVVIPPLQPERTRTRDVLVHLSAKLFLPFLWEEFTMREPVVLCPPF
jgi:hypothetical protein